MKTMIFADFAVLFLGAVAAGAYHTPAHDYYRNNWMASGG